MKIRSLKTREIYDIEIRRPGENQMPCPECSGDRKKANAKPFSFNAAKGVGKCHHCLADFVTYSPSQNQRDYKIPEWKNDTKLTDAAAKWFHDRGIEADTLNKMKITSDMEFMPQTGKPERVICFPYLRDGEVVNIKYRDGSKNFKLFSGAELILYNLDGIKGEDECVIVEGEIDCLSFIQVGITNVVSVPNGAGSTNLEYIDNCFNNLDEILRFYIAVDNDAPGYKLRDELIRRLGAERCAVVQFDDCKDANEYLTNHGGYELGGILKNAKDVPVDGVVYQADIYDDIYNLYLNGLMPGVSLGIPTLDDLMTWETGRLAVVTGIPGHGKSEIVDYFVTLLNVMHGWRAAYYSPENHPLQLHFSKIASKITGKTFAKQYIGHNEFEKTFEYINSNFFFINPERDVTIENILSRAEFLVRRQGIKVLVIDPYNKLEHLRDKSESETEYISKFLDKLSMFSHQHNCLVILVAHPRKMDREKDSGKFQVPTLYDINASANFYNKCDYGIVVYRDRAEDNVRIIVSKVKFKHLGMGGDAVFKYNAVNGRIHANEPEYDNLLTRDFTKEPTPVIQLDDEDMPF